MNRGEYEVMARVEAHHWWYCGLRDLLARCLRHPDLALPAEPRILDAGCGTGGNLSFLHDLLQPSYLGGFDLSPDALEHARRKGSGADVYASDVCDPIVHVDELDLVVSLDVIYIPGAARAREGLRHLVSCLRPGGLFVLNLPAFDWLYSEHDVAVHTQERFTTAGVRELLEGLELSVARLSYRVCALFPAVLLARLPQKLRTTPDASRARSDLHQIPGPFLNRLLAGVLAAENRVLARGVSLPFGSSVFAIGRKPAP